MAVVLSSSTAWGEVLIELNTVFPEGSGSKPDPDGSPPWLRALFEDNADDATIATDKVRLTLTSLLSLDNEVKGGSGQESSANFGWGFNYIDDDNVGLLSFAFQSGNDADSIELGKNHDKADGQDSSFDIVMGWQASGSFDGTETAEYLIMRTDSASLVANDFDAQSFGTGISMTSAAHVQSISASAGSTWIYDGDSGSGGGEIPEPLSLAVWLGLIGVGLAIAPSARSRLRD